MHIGAIIALAAVLVFVVIVGLLSYLVFVKFLRRDAGRQRAEAADFFVRAAAGSLGERWQGWHEHFERERGWFFGLGGYCDMRIESGGHKLAGHVVDQNAEITVIILHGYGGIASSLTSITDAKAFYETGYNICIPDIRGHGESEGKYFGMGYVDFADILAWIDNLPGERFVIYGISMGGAVALSVASRGDARIAAVISDSTYTSLTEMLPPILKKMLKIDFLTKIVTRLGRVWCRIIAGYDFGKDAPIDRMKYITAPTLIFHGDADTFVPYPMGKTLFNACAARRKQYHSIPGGTHQDCNFRYQNQQYIQVILDFLKEVRNVE